VYYVNVFSDAAQGAPPFILHVFAYTSGNDIQFQVHATDPIADVLDVWVTFTGLQGTLHGEWQSLHLERDPVDLTLWSGTVNAAALGTTLPTELRFMAQAVNRAGGLTLVTNDGAFFQPDVDPGAPSQSPPSAPPAPEPEPTVLTLETPPATVTYGTEQSVSAVLTSGGLPVAGETVDFSLGSQQLSATTDSDGRATVTFAVLTQPGSYELQASYNGTPVLAGSVAGSIIILQKQGTLLSLELSVATVSSGDPYQATATLTDAGGRPIADRTVIFVIRDASQIIVYQEPAVTSYAGEALLENVALPVGTYAFEAYFSGLVPGAPEPLVDAFYEPSVATGPALTVTPGNAAPSAAPDSFTVVQGAVLSVPAATLLANDNDVDGDTLTSTAARLPEHGALSVVAGGFDYAPDAGFNGVDTFTYLACDDEAACAVATVSISVLPAPLEPALVPDAPVVVVPEGETANLSGTVSNYGVGASLSYAASVGAVTDEGDGAWSWSYPTTDGPDESTQVIITLDYGFGTTEAAFDLTVNNVVPTVELTGPASVEAGAAFSLGIGAPQDPGDDTVTHYHITWGDGTAKEIVSGGPVTHIYNSAGNYAISVDAVDEDGEHIGAGGAALVVTPPPTPSVTIHSTLLLHIIDQQQPRTACPNLEGSCKLPQAGALVRAFSRDALTGVVLPLLDGLTLVTLTRNPDPELYPDIFENAPQVDPALLAGECTTNSSGSCPAIVPVADDYLVIVRFQDGDVVVYTGRNVGDDDFVDTDGNGSGDVAAHELQILKFLRQDGQVEYGGCCQTVYLGSMLEVVALDYAA
jgi:hypothetical protein